MTPILELNNIRGGYGTIDVLHGVNLKVEAGQVHALLGPNGAGKTTFFNAISGVIEPTSGRLLAMGRDLTGQRPHRYAAQGLARTFQTPRTFGDMTVAANVDFGLKFAGKRPRRYIWWGEEQGVPWALRDVAGILRLIGLEAQAEARAADLTPTQQRLLEIGMALATRPKVLLLDEVAAGLTEAELEDMARLIRRLRDELDLTIVWIEHAVTVLLRHVERVIVLHQGRKIADAPPREVIRNPEVIEAYLGDEMAATPTEGLS